MSATKGVPLTKDEVALLIDFIEGNKVITSKATNATNNQLKEVAWAQITDSFNASVSSCPRRTDQLKLKWENLKKSARKRSTKIRMNHIKTGGGKPDYIPPDDALDRVASILGATCEGYSVAYGGDSEQIALHDSMAEVSSVDVEILSDGGGVIVSGVGEGDFESGGGAGNGGSLLGIGSSPDNDHNVIRTPKPKKFFFSTPSGKSVGMYLLCMCCILRRGTNTRGVGRGRSAGEVRARHRCSAEQAR